MTIESTNRFQAEQYLSNAALLSRFMPIAQRFALKELIKGEEGEHFVDIVLALVKTIREMPVSYETDGQGGDAIVHLHYFGGSYDAWVTERDVGELARNDIDAQHQAFGKVCLGGGDAELGYISIEEVIQSNLELDLYWIPKPLKEI